MSLHQDSVVQMSKMLRNLDAFLQKAVALAEARKFKADDFVSFKLCPDMRPLSFQVQSACDTAKFTAARLAGIDAPANPDTETTMAELSARIAATLGFLESVGEKQFEGAETREIRLSFLPGNFMYGPDYLRDFALPNFYFHVTTAYALLRSAGVELGKRDFIGGLTLHPDAS